MWQNNGYGSNGHFPNSFNNQENFPTSPFGTPSAPGQQFFTNPQNRMHFDDANGEGFLKNEFQPEVGLYNEGAFMQNQFINANPQVSVVERYPIIAAVQQPRPSCYGQVVLDA